MSRMVATTALVLFTLCCQGGCDSPSSQPAAGGAAEAPEIVAQKATAGVGKKGQKLDQHSDMQKIISGPAAALFRVEQKAVFDIKIPHALNLYKATNGHFPKTHEDFMREIVEFNRIELPELPAGAVYRFDSEKGELWVYPEDDVPQE